LVRKLVNPTEKSLNEYVEKLGCTLGEELIKPTKIYVKTILALIEKYDIKGISHITGGGFVENIPRMIPDGLRVNIQKGSWPILPIFNLLKDLGNMEENDIFNTFNMGIGMVLAVEAGKAEEITDYLKSVGQEAFIIGSITEGEAGVDIC